MKLDTHTPHVEHDWAEAFLLELRLRGVDGRRIGAALAEVEAHCAESGEAAREAFGDPAAYAAELDLPPSPQQPAGWRSELVSSALGLSGMLTTLAALGAWQRDTWVEVTTGSVAVVALLVAGTALLVGNAERLLRAVVKHWWVAMVGAFVPLALFVVVLVLGTQVILSVPRAPTLVAGLVLLLVHTVVAVRTRKAAEDPVVGPAAAAGAGTLADGRFSHVAAHVGPWLFAILTVLMAIPLLLV